MKDIKDLKLRTHLKPGDIGYITYLHGKLYKEEYDYEIQFETYVADGLNEFYRSRNPERSRAWIFEHNDKIVAFILLMDRNESAQLRFFLVAPEYRGLGLGKRLMDLYFEFFNECGYKSSYLWTTHELVTAAALYSKYGFVLTEEKESTKFGKKLLEQRYDYIRNS